jgi:hypothetical protein
MRPVVVSSAEEAARAMCALLGDPERRLGEAGRERVRQDFLITGNLRRWLVLLDQAAHPEKAGAPRAAAVRGVG